MEDAQSEALIRVAEVALPWSLLAPRRARTFVREQATACGSRKADIDTAELLISELVTNVLDHAHPPLMLAVGCSDRTLRVSVRDGCPDLPAVSGAELRERLLPPEGTAVAELPESGRGMPMLDALSSAWGIRPATNGKSVWFELRT